MGEKGIKNLLFLHIEKIAVVVVILIILAYLISLVSSPSKVEELRTRTDKAIEKIKTAAEDPDVPPLVEVTYAEDLKEGFDSVPPEGRKPQWFSYKRPYVVRVAKFEYPEQPVHEAPTLVLKYVGEVDLSWTDSDENRFIEIKKYVLRRKEGADGVWEKLKEFDTETHEYTDKAVRPDTQYFYKLTSIAEPTETGVQFDDHRQESGEHKVDILFNLEFGSKGIITSGDGSSPSHFLIIEVIYHTGRNKTVRERIRLERGTPIKVKGIDTGWKLKEFKVGKGETPGKRNMNIKIKSADGRKIKEFQFPIK